MLCPRLPTGLRQSVTMPIFALHGVHLVYAWRIHFKNWGVNLDTSRC